jgi:hypothetical protein
MRNGDFVPSRMQAQFDAVNMVAVAKTKSNPENNVGLLSLAEYVFKFSQFQKIFDNIWICLVIEF